MYILIILFLTSSDINECDENMGICGDDGSCSNIGDGGFYRCNCDTGYIAEGDASDLSLECVGGCYDY